MNKHRENEIEYIESIIKNNTDLTGWVCDDEDDDGVTDWYHINADHTYPSIKVIKINDTLCAFNEAGRALDCFVSCGRYKEEGDLEDKWILNTYFEDESKLTPETFLSFDDSYYFFLGRDGLARDKVIDIKFSDGNTYQYVVDSNGHKYSQEFIGDKLCVNGLIANKNMFLTPYKKFGTIMRNGIPYLCDPEGRVLNTNKFKYKDGRVYAYINTDRTFFYSTKANDPKWY